MVEKIRVYRGSTELNVASGSITKTDDYVVDGGVVEIEGDSSVDAGSVLDFKLSDGVTTVFSAKVVNKKRGMTWQLPILTNGWELHNIRVEQVWENKSPEYIVQDIIDNYTENLTYASTATSGVTLTKYVAKGQYAIDIIVEMMTLLDWKAKADENDNFYFEPTGTTNNGLVLTNGSDFEVKEWNDGDIRTIVNHVKIKGGNITNNTTEAKTGTDTVFTLDHKPKGNLRVTVSGTEIAADVNNTNYSVDADNKIVTFTSSQTNPVFEYEFDTPIIIEDQDDDSIAAYGRVFKEVSVPTLSTFADARRFARQYLNTYSQPLVACKGSIADFNFDISVNEEVSVVDPIRSKTATLIINSITYVIDGGRTDVELGPKEIDYGDKQREVEERIKKLERQIQNEDDVVYARTIRNKIKQEIVHTATPYLQFPNDSFIIGHSTLGRLRTNLNFEADCSNNGNHGVWSGSGIDGEQYVAPAWTDTNCYYRLKDNPSNGVVTDYSYSYLSTPNNADYIINVAGYYSFTGNANDSSTTGNDGSWTGTEEYVDDHIGTSEGAASFDGSSYITVPDDSSNDLSDTFTLGIRFKTSSSGDYACLLSKQNHTAGYYPVYNILQNQSDGKIRVQLRESGGTLLDDVYSDSPLNDDNWHSIIFVNNNKSTIMYVDGVAQTDTNTYTGTMGSSNDSLMFGAWSADSGTPQDFFNGEIADILLVKGVAFTSVDAAHYHEITSNHKLDAPLTTKTDADGKTITGYEIFSKDGSTAVDSSNYSNEILSTASVGLTQLGTWTVAMKAYVYSGFTRANANIFNASNGASNRINASLSGNTIGFQRYDGASYTGVQYNYEGALDKVRSLVFENDAGTVKMYIDGVEIGSSGNNYIVSTTSGFMRIGDPSVTTNGSKGINAIITEPVVFNRLLSQDEKNNFTDGKPVENLYYGGGGPRLSYGTFNGTDNYVNNTTIEPTDLQGGFSVCAWIKPTINTGTTNHRIVDMSAGTSGNGGFYFLYNDTDESISFSVNAGTPLNSGASSINEGYWQHVTVTVEADGTALMYIDGLQVDSDSTGACSGITTTNDLTIGSRSGTDRWFDGEIDEVMIFNKVITTDTIDDIMKNDFYSNHSSYGDCILWYSFDNPRIGDRLTQTLPTEDFL